MKQQFTTFQRASWLLSEAYDPEDPMNSEDEELDTEDSEGEDEEEDSDEEGTEEESEELEELEDEEDEEADELEDIEELETDEELDVETISDKLDDIETKLDQLTDKPQNPADDDEVFDLDVANPVCPCCGSRLNIVDTEGAEEDAETGEDLVDLDDLEGSDEETADIVAMDDDLDNVTELGYENDGEYVTLDDLISGDEDEDEE